MALNGHKVLTMAHTSLGTRVNHKAKGCKRLQVDRMAWSSVDHGTYITWDANTSQALGCYSNIITRMHLEGGDRVDGVLTMVTASDRNTNNRLLLHGLI